MRGKRLVAAATVLLLPVALAATRTAVAAPEAVPGAAPRLTHPVGVRTLALARGPDRPLPTTVWYPASSGSVGGPPRPGVPAAVGRFPIVLFSHGLHSLPGRHAPLTTRWAAAGFVVAAPAYPHTRLRAARFDRGDVRRQPADAWHVIRAVARLDTTPGDLFAGRLATARVAAAGHSAGGFTTAAMFTAGHPQSLRGGIVIAGGTRGVFAGPPAALLFVHGSADRVVPAARGRAAFERAPWPSGLLILTGQDHGGYLTPGRPGFDEVAATTLDFLRWVLYDDAGARQRLPTDAAHPGLTRWESRI